MNLRLLAPTYYDRHTTIMGMANSNGRILDLGCADGFYSRSISRSDNQVIGIDSNTDYIHFSSLNENLHFLQTNGENLPFKNFCFDSVLCVDVIEHIDDDTAVISEIGRVLKPGGQLVLSVPNINFPLTYDPINFILKLFHKHLPIGIWGFGHKRLYSASVLVDVLSKYNLSVVNVGYLTHSFAALCENYLSTVFQGIAEHEKKTNRRNLNKYDKWNGVYNIAYNLTKIIVQIDRRLLKKSKNSVGFVVCAVRL